LCHPQFVKPRLNKKQRGLLNSTVVDNVFLQSGLNMVSQNKYAWLNLFKLGVASIVVACASMNVSADDRFEHGHGYGHGGWHGGGDWHGRDMHHFDHHDMDMWRGGHWVHDHHEGRMGWWWVAAGSWFLYSAANAANYAYPPPQQVVINQPTPVVVQAPQPVAQYWYYCDVTGGYYPSTPSCPVPWRVVSPQMAPQQAMPPPPGPMFMPY